MDSDYLLEPKLMLFMSVDVINSTAYKNKQPQQNTLQTVHPWLCFFTDFHREFPQLFYEAVNKTSPVLPLPDFWKSAGDELLFCVQLKSYTDPLSYITAFKDTVNTYVKSIRKKDDFLSLKATAWLAGFPVMNAVLRLDAANNEVSYDYIGPNVDLGFRLRHLATRQKFIISVDLALMLAEDMIQIDQSKRVDIFFDGREELKGILAQDGYPVFWVDMFNNNHSQELTELQKMENTFLKKDYQPHHCTPDEVKKYCLLYFDTQKGKFIIPFIDGDEIFGDRPDGYKELLNSVSELYRESNTGDTLALDTPEATTNVTDIENLIKAKIPEP